MLFLLNTFFSSNVEIIYDNQTCQCIFLIKKNASTSLFRLSKEHSDRFSYFHGESAVEFLQKNKITSVTVFIRDPIGRFLSGLGQQMNDLGITQKNLDIHVFQTGYIDERKNDNMHLNLSLFDLHTAPQFWSLYRLHRVLPDIKFYLLDLKEYFLFYPFAPIENQRLNKPIVPPNAMDQLDFYLSEDIVLYNQCLNQTLKFDEIVEKIKLERNFVNEISSYKDILCLYL